MTAGEALGPSETRCGMLGIRRPRTSWMVRIALLFLVYGLTLFQSHAQTQDFYRFPFREGNFLRYRMADWVNDTSFILSFSQRGVDPSDPDLLLDSVIVKRTGTRMLDMTNWALVRIRADGMLVVNDSVFRYSPREYREWEFIPAIPPTDTVYQRNLRIKGDSSTVLSQIPMRLLRKFDTTVFDVPTRAFSVENLSFNEPYIYTIADGFGLVIAERIRPANTPETMYLSGAVIDGRPYNWDSTRYDYLPLCDGDIHQFRTNSHIFMPASRDTTWFDTDTVRSAGLINGEEWFRFQHMLLRHEQDGVYYLDTSNGSPRKFMLHSDYALPGCIVAGWRITGRGSRSVFGETRTHISRVPFFGEGGIVDGPDVWDEWADGIGKISSFVGNNIIFWGSNDYGSLIYARICGSEYGSMVSVPEPNAPLPSNPSILEVYPNPAAAQASGGTTITVALPHAMQASVAVYSLLGNRVAFLHEGPLVAGLHDLHWDTGALPRGVYVVILLAGKERSSRLLILQ